jgi:hypothetical protein
MIFASVNAVGAASGEGVSVAAAVAMCISCLK